MKSIKRIFLILLAFTLLFTLIACGGGDEKCKHADKNKDGVCDECEVCIKHIDDDEDGLCDNCDEELDDGSEVREGIALIADGEILFQIVLGSDIGSVKMLVDDFADFVEELGGELSVVTDDKKNKEADIEVLVGTVTSRGKDYEYDRYSLGAEGYAVTALDETKIIISGGTESTLSDAFTKFTEDILGIDDKTDELPDVTFTEDDEILEIQDDYRITGITIDGNDLKGYKIVRDWSVSEYKESIEKLQDFFYTKAGYYLPIVSPEEAGDKYISFAHVGKNEAGENGFRVRVEDGNLIIECAYNNLFARAFDEFYNQNFTGKQGDINITEFTSKEINISVVTYEDFGAVGNGKTDDTEAIRAAHNAANAGGQKVLGTKGKTYYVSFTYDKPIPIMTDVDWRGCKFIFDASAITNENDGHIFEISQTKLMANEVLESSDSRIVELNKPAEKGEPVIKGIEHGDEQTTKLDLGIGVPAMLIVTNKNSRNYMRWGLVDARGDEQKEVVLVDKDGNIDPSTPFLLDYEKITSITIHRINVEAITIQNATIEHPASLINLGSGVYHAYTHGILITRPNTVVKNITHIITGEIAKNTPVKVDKNGLSYDVTGEGYSYIDGKIYTNDGKTEYKGTEVTPFTGPSFSGIIDISETHNVSVEDCVFQARYHYVEGTYDIDVGASNEVVFKNCIQSNFFDTSEECTRYNNGVSTSPNLTLCWGIMGSSYCKNLQYYDCELTRFDAHRGVFNATIKGGKIAVFRLIGGGTVTIEDIEIFRTHHSTEPFQLREDYGATFYGTVIIRNVIIRDGKYSSDGKIGELSGLFSAPTAPWINGYVNHFPNIIIDNIEAETSSTELPILRTTTQTYDPMQEHYPARCPIRQDVSNPDALFTTYYETKNPNIVDEKPDMFYYLEGFKKVNKLPNLLKNGEYTVVDNKNGTYTVVAAGVKNINPYQPPEFIEVYNMKGKTNSNGKALSLVVYDCNFFNNTKIVDADGVVKRLKAPK